MWRTRMVRAGGAAVLASMIGAFAMSADTSRADEVAQPVKAVWQVQEIYLSYFGLTTYYSCDGLRDKVEGMIKTLGASDNSMVTTAGCTDLVGPERIPGARIIMATPQAATPEVLAAMAKDPKRAGLLEKLQKKGGTPLDTGEFNAVRKVVTLNTKDSMQTGSAGDCELVEHMRRQVVKKMDAKVVKDNVTCTPGTGTVGSLKMEVEVLVKA